MIVVNHIQACPLLSSDAANRKTFKGLKAMEFSSS